MPTRSSQNEILILGARSCSSPEIALRIESLANASIDWRLLQKSAWKHGVLPLVYQNIRPFLPPEVEREWKKRVEDNARRNLALTAELLNLLDKLSSAGITAIPYKGPLLAIESYGNVSLRQFVDLDILIDRADILRAKRVLLKDGYTPDLDMDAETESRYLRSQFEYNFHRGDRAVEIHWSILPQYFNVSISHSDWLKQSVSIRLGSKEVRSLSPEDTLFVICLHGSKHLWERLGWVADVAETLRAHPNLSWDRLGELAQRSGNQALVNLGLCLSQRLFEVALPHAVQGRFESTVRVMSERLASAIIEGSNDSQSGWRRAWFFLLAKNGFWNRVRLAVRLGLSPTEREWERVRMPKALSPLYAALRPFRLLADHGVLPHRHA